MWPHQYRPTRRVLPANDDKKLCVRTVADAPQDFFLRQRLRWHDKSIGSQVPDKGLLLSRVRGVRGDMVAIRRKDRAREILVVLKRFGDWLSSPQVPNACDSWLFFIASLRLLS